MNNCCLEKIEMDDPKSENVRVIARNVEDFLWKVRDCKGVEAQEKYTLALFQKLATAKTIEDLANMTIDMNATLQKIKLKKENKEEDMEEKEDNGIFIELFNVDAPETEETD